MSKKKELEGLEKMRTSEIIASRHVPEGANVLGKRIGPAIKNVKTTEEKLKASLFVKVHTDRDKCNVIHDPTTLHQNLIRIIVAMAASAQYILEAP